jgi:hypothetical protein
MAPGPVVFSDPNLVEEANVGAFFLIIDTVGNIALVALVIYTVLFSDIEVEYGLDAIGCECV